MAQRPRRHQGALRRLPVVWHVTVTALVVALIPLLALGVGTSMAQRRALNSRAADDLAALASAKQAHLELIGASAFNGARLVASRTQLRRDLAAVLDGDPVPLQRMADILDDARESTADLLVVAVTDPQGRVVAASGLPADGRVLPIVADLELAAHDLDPTLTISRIEHDDTGPRWMIATPLLLEDRVLGAAVTEQDLDRVRALARGPDVLGRGIEVSVIHRLDTGEPAFLVAPADLVLPDQPELLVDAPLGAQAVTTTDIWR